MKKGNSVNIQKLLWMFMWQHLLLWLRLGVARGEFSFLLNLRHWLELVHPARATVVKNNGIFFVIRCCRPAPWNIKANITNTRAVHITATGVQELQSIEWNANKLGKSAKYIRNLGKRMGSTGVSWWPRGSSLAGLGDFFARLGPLYCICRKLVVFWTP